MEELRNALIDLAFSSKNRALDGFSARTRHLKLINKCFVETTAAEKLCFNGSVELAAEHPLLLPDERVEAEAGLELGGAGGPGDGGHEAERVDLAVEAGVQGDAEPSAVVVGGFGARSRKPSAEVGGRGVAAM